MPPKIKRRLEVQDAPPKKTAIVTYEAKRENIIRVRVSLGQVIIDANWKLSLRMPVKIMSIIRWLGSRATTFHL